MDIAGKNLWQIAAGNGDNTHYAQQCLDAGVILVGPGKWGPWPDCEADMRAGGFSSFSVGKLRRFTDDIKVGDLVVLRVGTREVYGVGEVIGSYDWRKEFGNVQGWDLQHCRSVRGLWKANPSPKVFETYAMKFGSSVQRLISPQVQAWMKTL